jgi:Na+/H+ antiporter NhaD/arsenite permease-like protein
MVLGAVFINHPPFLREAVMLAAAIGSYFTTWEKVHEANDFNFHPIKEVAILFAGIFATMMPALDWLQANAAQLGQPTPSLFFWGSGVLSSVLDNAPTYLSFLSVEFGAFATPDTAAAIVDHVHTHGADLSALTAGPQADQIRQAVAGLQRWYPTSLSEGRLLPEQAQLGLVLGNSFYAKCLAAISIGSVFFGANTYIGNGPNFMVKSIADAAGLKTPSFFTYIWKYTLPILIPIYMLIWLIFFARH